MKKILKKIVSITETIENIAMNIFDLASEYLLVAIIVWPLVTILGAAVLSLTVKMALAVCKLFGLP